MFPGAPSTEGHWGDTALPRVGRVGVGVGDRAQGHRAEPGVAARRPSGGACAAHPPPCSGVPCAWGVSPVCTLDAAPCQRWAPASPLTAAVVRPRHRWGTARTPARGQHPLGARRDLGGRPRDSQPPGTGRLRTQVPGPRLNPRGGGDGSHGPDLPFRCKVPQKGLLPRAALQPSAPSRSLPQASTAAESERPCFSFQSHLLRCEWGQRLLSRFRILSPFRKPTLPWLCRPSGVSAGCLLRPKHSVC